jgi:hypothetical protein
MPLLRWLHRAHVVLEIVNTGDHSLVSDEAGIVGVSHDRKHPRLEVAPCSKQVDSTQCFQNRFLYKVVNLISVAAEAMSKASKRRDLIDNVGFKGSTSHHVLHDLTAVNVRDP